MRKFLAQVFIYKECENHIHAQHPYAATWPHNRLTLEVDCETVMTYVHRSAAHVHAGMVWL